MSAHINACVNTGNMTDMAANLFFLHPLTLLTVYNDKLWEQVKQQYEAAYAVSLQVSKVHL